MLDPGPLLGQINELSMDRMANESGTGLTISRQQLSKSSGEAYWLELSTGDAHHYFPNDGKQQLGWHSCQIPWSLIQFQQDNKKEPLLRQGLLFACLKRVARSSASNKLNQSPSLGGGTTLGLP